MHFQTCFCGPPPPKRLPRKRHTCELETNICYQLARSLGKMHKALRGNNTKTGSLFVSLLPHFYDNNSLVCQFASCWRQNWWTLTHWFVFFEWWKERSSHIFSSYHTRLFSTAYWSVFFFSLYQPITINNCVFMCVCVHVSVCMHACVHVCVCMCACMCVCLCVRVCVMKWAYPYLFVSTLGSLRWSAINNLTILKPFMLLGHTSSLLE